MTNFHLNFLGSENVKKCRQLRETVISETKCDMKILFNLLLNTAQFENKLENTYRTILDEGNERWKRHQKECKKHLEDLAKSTSEQNLNSWILAREKQVQDLDFEDPLASGRTCVLLVEALKVGFIRTRISG